MYGAAVGGNLLARAAALLGPYTVHPVASWVTSVLGWAVDVARALGVPRIGMVGAAWATVLARAVVLVPVALLLVSRFELGRPPPAEAAPDPRALRGIVSIAWPSSAQFVVRIAAMLLVNSLVARFFTTATDQTATTAMGLVFRLDAMAAVRTGRWAAAPRRDARRQTLVAHARSLPALSGRRAPRAVLELRAWWSRVGADDALDERACSCLLRFS